MNTASSSAGWEALHRLPWGFTTIPLSFVLVSIVLLYLRRPAGSHPASKFPIWAPLEIGLATYLVRLGGLGSRI